MKSSKNILGELGWRERQIVEAVVKLGEASAMQVRAEIPDPPTYTSIRTMLQMLVKKNILQFRNDGKRYLYRVKANRDSVRATAVKNLLTTFFSNNASAAIATILDLAGDRLQPEEIADLRQKIEHTRKEDTR